MAKNYIQVGNTLVLVAPTGGVISGQLYVIGSLPVVAEFSAAEGDLFEGTACGVYQFPKTAANTPAAGAKAYYDTTLHQVTTTATANTLIGVFTEAYANGTTVANVRLNGVAV